MTPIIALFALQQSPKDIMQAYWDKLGMADKIHARIEMSGGPVAPTYAELWLEKPGRMRSVSGDKETRVDGDMQWSINLKAKTYQVAGRYQYWCSPLFEPFFNMHTFNQPEMSTWAKPAPSGEKKMTALLLRSKNPDWANYELYVDPATSLPLALRSATNQGPFGFRVLDISVNPKWKFDWPSLDGYKKIDN